MKKTTKISFIIAAGFWIIGTILLHKEGESTNPGVIVTGIIILIGFITQLMKKEKNY